MNSAKTKRLIYKGLNDLSLATESVNLVYDFNSPKTLSKIGFQYFQNSMKMEI